MQGAKTRERGKGRETEGEGGLGGAEDSSRREREGEFAWLFVVAALRKTESVMGTGWVVLGFLRGRIA